MCIKSQHHFFLPHFCLLSPFTSLTCTLMFILLLFYVTCARSCHRQSEGRWETRVMCSCFHRIYLLAVETWSNEAHRNDHMIAKITDDLREKHGILKNQWYEGEVWGFRNPYNKRTAGIPRFIVLLRYCVFYKLKVCGNPVSSKSTSTIFSTAFANFVSLCHILVILAIF